MKKNKKLYYYEYDENKEILKVTEGVPVFKEYREPLKN